MSRTARALRTLTAAALLFCPAVFDVVPAEQAAILGHGLESTLPPYLAIDNSVDLCGYPSVGGDSVNISFSPGTDADIASVVIYWSAASSPDVYDHYERPSPNDGVLTLNGAGAWATQEPFSIAGLEEGIYRVRAVVTMPTGIVTEDFNHDGKFDDFTFDAYMKSHHILMNVDRSVTDVSFSLSAATIEAGTDVTVTVTPEEVCDIEEICYGLLASNGVPIYGACLSDLAYSFNPAAAGLVTLRHGFWHGPLALAASDPLGNSITVIDHSDLYVLIEEVMVVCPEWDSYLTGEKTEIRARKWSSSPISKVEFFYGGAVGPGTSLGVDNHPDGDEFSIIWDLADVAEVCVQHIWVSSRAGESSRIRPLPVICECWCPYQGDTEPDGRITSLDVVACLDIRMAGGRTQIEALVSHLASIWTATGS